MEVVRADARRLPAGASRFCPTWDRNRPSFVRADDATSLASVGEIARRTQRPPTGRVPDSTGVIIGSQRTAGGSLVPLTMVASRIGRPAALLIAASWARYRQHKLPRRDRGANFFGHVQCGQ